MNPILCHYNEKLNNFFEGWYYKCSFKERAFSLIPGYSINNGNKKTFIQYIDNEKSLYFEYDFSDFIFNKSKLFINIKNNLFSNNRIIFNEKDININIDIKNNTYYNQGKLNFGIMGPFSLFNMQCNHGINILNGHCEGFYNEEKISKGKFYMEKDWGTSFPKSYIWLQGNNFNDDNTSLVFSIAKVPFLKSNFWGFISILNYKNEQIKFTSYNFSKNKVEINNDDIKIILRNKIYKLIIKTKITNGFKLKSPFKGNMNNNVNENLNNKIHILLYKKNEMIYEDTSFNCGFEIYNYIK